MEGVVLCVWPFGFFFFFPAMGQRLDEDFTLERYLGREKKYMILDGFVALCRH